MLDGSGNNAYRKRTRCVSWGHPMVTGCRCCGYRTELAHGHQASLSMSLGIPNSKALGSCNIITFKFSPSLQNGSKYMDFVKHFYFPIQLGVIFKWSLWLINMHIMTTWKLVQQFWHREQEKESSKTCRYFWPVIYLISPSPYNG